MGDDAFALKSWLLKPYLKLTAGAMRLTHAEKVFNCQEEEQSWRMHSEDHQEWNLTCIQQGMKGSPVLCDPPQPDAQILLRPARHQPGWA